MTSRNIRKELTLKAFSRVVFIVMLVLVVVMFKRLHAQQVQPNAQQRLYLPNLQRPDPEIFYGDHIETVWYEFQPHYTVIIGQFEAGTYNCTELKWTPFFGSAEDVTDGHWRNYEPYGTEEATNAYQLTKSFVVPNYVRGALVASRYQARCKPVQ